jgi:SAM-dependent methyltransferase
MTNQRNYWNNIADEYQSATRIATDAFHFGPLLPSNRELQLFPVPGRGQRCLELGCGAGQNSIYLARHGADCTAIDISGEQLAHGRKLAKEAGVDIDFREADIDDLPTLDLGTFDFIHSVYGLPFAHDPGRVIAESAKRLSPGGIMVITVGHPVFAGEFIEVDDGEFGMFVTDYFKPPADTRFIGDSDDFINSRSWPLSDVSDWLLDAGLQIRRMAEPGPAPIPILDEEAIAEQVPYDSPGWRGLYHQLIRVPVVAVFVAQK